MNNRLGCFEEKCTGTIILELLYNEHALLNETGLVSNFDAVIHKLKF